MSIVIVSDAASGCQIWAILLSSVFEELRGKREEVLKKNTLLQAETAFLKSTDNILHININQLEQYSRSKNIEIRCIPIVKDEDFIIISQSIDTKIHCPSVTSDIVIVHRVSTADRTQTNLFARFVPRTKVLEFQRRAQKLA